MACGCNGGAKSTPHPTSDSRDRDLEKIMTAIWPANAAVPAAMPWLRAYGDRTAVKRLLDSAFTALSSRFPPGSIVSMNELLEPGDRPDGLWTLGIPVWLVTCFAQAETDCVERCGRGSGYGGCCQEQVVRFKDNGMPDCYCGHARRCGEMDEPEHGFIASTIIT